METRTGLSNFLSFAVFIVLFTSSLLAGHYGYSDARSEITADLNRALSLAIREQQQDIVTPDTIRAYRHLRSTSGGNVLMAVADDRFCKHLSNDELKNSAFISIDLVDDSYVPHNTCDGMICGDTMVLSKKCHGETIALRGYARLSAASIFKISDQRTSSALLLMSIAWAVVSLCHARRRRENEKNERRYGTLIYSADAFYTSSHQPVHFTPMQHQLMQMFLETPSHTLTKEEICDALWPKKDDANDTLYTLIRRIKPVLEAETNLVITSDRSRGYILEIR